MTERVHPSAKASPSNPPPKTLNGPSAPKPHLPNPTRHLYPPTVKPTRRRRRSCCLCCIWFTIFLLALILLAAIAGGVIWLLYRPHRPSFSVSTLKLTTFNLTTAGSAPRLNSRLDLSIYARNPNKKLVFFYDPISVAVSSGTGVDVGDGSFPPFVHGTRNTTTMKASVSSGGGRELDAGAASSLSSELKANKNRLQVEIRMDTKVRVKMGGLKTKKVGISVLCRGIEANIPKGNSTGTMSSSSSSDCEVKLRIKIWKWHI
ncbi:protein YLS9-like protein [Cinnamomum micranthum f. kanehirae]|uniref:Protein YLS9-like protein n=1 Tax=Cinnamomum micranthum f. kanehirae TaxID=337451 RepID=A0A3S3NMM2_9MAGN|nr:protein YLS9-like protein [Cinnamomum micranthum f. kanehirae]